MLEAGRILQQMNEAINEKSSIIKDMDAVYQFNFKNSDSATYQLVIREENSFVIEGIAEKADCTLHMKTEHFTYLATGKLSGTKAFLSGKLKVERDMRLAIRLQDLISLYNKQ
ncbi:hypothetical protein J32TS6_37500 [Virgibacillus pantothenticus]|uniref:SCP2 sterol-binding domain-containing protein n=1 Tax=Virgibacillus pantothenticus TaxID=1473 RepID=UPI001B07777C|nr:SCP2 sterol-binding domain-containing protein [Virgibacillus pantothenticus]GIP65195.1 hypothetical protein J32TS6_37500 [Virgibacillus pantothenticus]